VCERERYCRDKICEKDSHNTSAVYLPILSACPSCPPVRLPVCRLFVAPFVCLSVLPVNLFIRPSFRLSDRVCPSVRLTVRLSVCPSLYLHPRDLQLAAFELRPMCHTAKVVPVGATHIHTHTHAHFKLRETHTAITCDGGAPHVEREREIQGQTESVWVRDQRVLTNNNMAKYGYAGANRHTNRQINRQMDTKAYSHAVCCRVQPEIRPLYPRHRGQDG